MPCLAFFLMVLHIAAYSTHCLSSPYSTISRRFVIRAHVGDDNLDFSGLLIALSTLDALCWIMSVVVSLMVSMSSSSCSLCHQFVCFLLYVQFDVAHNQSVVTSNVDVVDDSYVCHDVWPVC